MALEAVDVGETFEAHLAELEIKFDFVHFYSGKRQEADVSEQSE